MGVAVHRLDTIGGDAVLNELAELLLERLNRRKGIELVHTVLYVM